MSNPIEFAIIGAGWRAEFFLRIAKQLPERFQVTGMVIRSEEKAREFEQKWGITSYRTIDELLEGCQFSFAVVSVPRKVAPDMMIKLVEEGVPVLCETPPATDLEGLVQMYETVGEHARIQIAEQYLYQPNHAARLQIVRSGRLGAISQAQISVAHDYHGISLIRQFLGVTYEDASISAIAFPSTIVDGPNRDGPPKEIKVVKTNQVIATLRFGEKEDQLGIYDFTGDQYFSWIRSPRMLIRGEHGEINNFHIRYLKDYLTPIEGELRRTNAGNDGNLEGYYLKGILFGEDYVYQNRFLPGRLTDDEIAIATTLEKMGQYAAGGPSFYSLAEASQDHYLALMIQKAIASGKEVTTTRQPWATNGRQHQ